MKMLCKVVSGVSLWLWLDGDEWIRVEWIRVDDAGGGSYFFIIMARIELQLAN